MRVPAKILHELRREFDCIPLDAVRARYRAFGHAGQHMVEAVAHFVEQRHDLIEGEAGGRTGGGRGHVAHQIGDGRAYGAVRARGARTAARRPGAFPFPVARVQIEVKVRDGFAAQVLQPKQANVVVPDAAFVGANPDVEQRFDEVE